MKYLFLLLSVCLVEIVYCQKALIKEISVSGNKKTKTKILLRELSFTVGDSILLSDLTQIFNQNSRYLIGTHLISKCNFKSKIENKNIHIQMGVVDAWYIYPIPIFELADRNFNVWWDEYNHDLTRTNYGIQLKHYNFTGRRDQLKVTAQNGYTQKIETDYRIPGINHKKTTGLFFNLYFKQSKETAYTTAANKLIFYKEDLHFNKSYRVILGLSLRPKLKTTHKFSLSFRQNKISSVIENDYNPQYFNNSKNKQTYFSAKYHFLYDTRDFEPYPSKGLFFSASISKNGLYIFNDIDHLRIESSARFYFPITKNTNISFFGKLKTVNAKGKLPYNQIRALGYRENQLHGYELYVIDGPHFGLIKTSLRQKIVDRKVNWKKWMPIKSFKIMPIEIFATLNNDIGYVHTNHYSYLGNLDNQLIWGGGLGVDIIFYTTFVLRLDYSVNQFKEKGIFLHFNPIF